MYTTKDLYCAVINAEANAELLKNVPHENMEDLAVIPKLRAKLGNYPPDKRPGFTVTHEMAEELGVSGEEALTIARRNTEEQGFQCTKISDYISVLMAETDVPDIPNVPDILDIPLYVVRTYDFYSGAAAIASEKTLNRLFKMFEEIYILPCSVQEVLILPKEGMQDEAEYLTAMVREINGTILKPGEWLSDNIYQYDGKTFSRVTLQKQQDPQIHDILHEMNKYVKDYELEGVEIIPEDAAEVIRVMKEEGLSQKAAMDKVFDRIRECLDEEQEEDFCREGK